jgi:hypothetical protein
MAEGVYEELNFIPSGGEHFYYSGVGNPIWTYDTANSYSDTYWGDGVTIPQALTVDQDWNPLNQHINDSSTENLGSTDFADAGFGSIQLDAARRDRTFRTSDADMLSTNCTVTEISEPADAGSSHFYTDYYYKARANRAWTADGTTDYFNQNSYDNPVRTTELDRSNQLITIISRQNTWYKESYSVDSFNRVYIDWDVTFTYTTEFTMDFYYEDTSGGLQSAYYGVADIQISPYLGKSLGAQTTADGASFDNNIDGTITYEIWDDTTTSLIDSSGEKFFTETDGVFSGNYIETQSTNFGSLLTNDGWYTYKIIVEVSHQKTGTFDYSLKDPVSLDYTGDAYGVQIDISSPYVSISETTPYDFASGSEEVLITSDWIDWGSDRDIVDGAPAVMDFGYYIPNELMDYTGGSNLLDNGSIIAYLEIDQNGNGVADDIFSKTSTETFDDVRAVDRSGYGTGCEKFSWNIDASGTDIRYALNKSTQIRWKIGVVIESGMELHYDTAEWSRIYFNNINFTVLTSTRITGTFSIREPAYFGGSIEPSINISISNGIDSYYLEDVSGSDVEFVGLYNDTWRIVINKTISTGQTLIIYNSTYELDIATTSFSDTLYCDLTNFEFTVQDHAGVALSGAEVVIKDANNLTETHQVTSDGAGKAFFEEVYVGDWLIVVSNNGHVIFNETRTIDYFGSGLEPGKYLINSLNTELILRADLTNIEFNFIDPDTVDIVGAQVALQNIETPSITRQGTTDGSGNVTFTELIEGNWQLGVQSANGFTVINQTYGVTADQDIIYDIVSSNLTNLILRINDYGAIQVSNIVDPTVYLTNIQTGSTYSQIAVGGNVTFTELYNGASLNDWRLRVDVTSEGSIRTIFNSSYNILNTSQDIVYDTITSNLTTFELEILDVDGVIIPDALVRLEEGANIYQGYTNASGKITFLEMYDATWTLTVNYTVGASDSLLKTEFTIHDDPSYTVINPTSSDDYFMALTLSNCNLTTLDIWVADGTEKDDNPDYAGLYKANITLQSATITKNISTFLSDADGNLQMRLPVDSYNFTAYYQDSDWEILFNDTGSWPADMAYTVSKTLTGYNNTELWVSVSDAKTSLANIDLIFQYDSSEWPNSNATTGDPPFWLELYYGDSFDITLQYQNNEGAAILGSTATVTWFIYDGITILNQTDNGSPEADGNVTASVFSTDYGCGLFTFEILVVEAGNQDALYTMDVEILNHTTILIRESSSGPITIDWGENLYVLMNYTTVLPEIANITSAHVEYEIIEIGGTTSLTPVGSSTGLYEFNLDTGSLDAGSFSILITAWKENVTFASELIYLTISPLSMKTDHEIDASFRVSSSFLKVAYSETLLLYFDVLYLDDSPVSSVDISAYIDLGGQIVFIQVDPFAGSWQFVCSEYINSSAYSAGVFTLYIELSKDNHVSTTIDIDLTILETWDTDLTSTVDSNKWGNNVTIEVEYSAIEEPRLGPLDSAVISQLSILDSDHVEITVLTAADSSLWSWSPLGAGKYEIVLNTSFLYLTQDTNFYVVPTISLDLYAPKTVDGVIFVDLLETDITLYMSTTEINSLLLSKGSSRVITAHLEVSEISSGILGQSIDGALLRSIERNDTDSTILSQQDLVWVGGGDYEFTVYADEIGNFTYEVLLITLDNHTLKQQILLPIKVLLSPSTYSVAIENEFKISAQALKVAYGEVLNFTLTFEEGLDSIPDLNVSMEGLNLDREVINDTTGIYEYSIAANNFTVGYHEIYIRGINAEANVEESVIEVDVLSAWDTVLDIIQPPKVYPWDNISTFVVKYRCVEQPRQSIVLSAAAITSLNITYEMNEFEILVESLTEDDIGDSWGWTNLKDDNMYGDGYYEIWVDTGILTILEEKLFYLIPTINESIYKETSAKPYVWITPVETTLTPYLTETSSIPLDAKNLYLDQSFMVYAHIEVSDEDSRMHGENLDGADVIYIILDEDDDEISWGTVDSMGNGYYSFEFMADRIGQFSVVLESSKTNFSAAQTSFLVNVLAIPIDITKGITIVDDVLFTPQNEEITFSLTVHDVVHDSPLSGATVTFELGGESYTIDESGDELGVYVITLTPDDLELLEADETYSLEISIAKTNYSTTVVTIALQVGLPVDPLLGWAYRYWMIMGVSIGAMVSIYGSYAYIKYANIPMIIKQINKTRKIISGKQSIVEAVVTTTEKGEIYELFAKDWEELDLDLEKILGLDKDSTQSDITSGDMAAGGF